MSQVNYIVYTDGFNELDDYFFKELEGSDNVKIVKKNTIIKNLLLQKIFKIHTSFKLNNIVTLPFQNLWYKKLFKKCDNDNPTIYIFFSSWYYPKFFNYIKMKNKKSKIVMYFGDTVESKKKVIKALDIDNLKNEVDLVLSYNEADVNKYKLIYLPMCYSKVNNNIDRISNEKQFDIIFIGASRNRFNDIVTIYEKIKKSNLKYFFYVVNSHKEKFVTKDPNFILTNSPMSYREYLGYVFNAKWLIEILDSGTKGTTLRFWDAVMYNKGLITNNKEIKKSPFFNSNSIIVESNFDELDINMINITQNIDYKYSGENSPVKFLEAIKDMLFKF